MRLIMQRHCISFVDRDKVSTDRLVSLLIHGGSRCLCSFISVSSLYCGKRGKSITSCLLHYLSIEKAIRHVMSST